MGGGGERAGIKKGVWSHPVFTVCLLASFLTSLTLVHKAQSPFLALEVVVRNECVNPLKTELSACLQCDEHAVNINCCCFYCWVPTGSWIQSRGTRVPCH